MQALALDPHTCLSCSWGLACWPSGQVGMAEAWSEQNLTKTHYMLRTRTFYM